MSPVDVGAAGDFPADAMTIVKVGDAEIGICRWGTEIFAIRSRCPHQAAPLCEGFLQTGLSAEFAAGELDVQADAGRPVILCPWHRWEFSLRDGTSVVPGFRARTYPVRIERGRVLVTIGRG